ncbi:hypothetical protein Syun_005928 [Stephania yunnanensis]|uniref:HAUS augmin-like complex subunit 1 n=1 Tax=Stephania yunnanensis TaxID=152371 RepID=A0AAP0KXD7_9MAGN
MSDLSSAVDPSISEATSGFDSSRIAEVKAWLVCQFEAAGKDVPGFEYTPRSVAHLHALATASQAKTQAAGIVAADLRQKATEYRSQVASVQVLANVANLLNVRDTEMSSYLVAMGDISLRKTGVEEKRAKVQKESILLLDYTRKAIARLTYLKRIFAQLEDDVPSCEAQMHHWKTNLEIMLSKERQYLQQYSNYKAILNRVGYTSDISHGVLVEMDEHRRDLEKKTKPILDTLRSYQDLPPVCQSYLCIVMFCICCGARCGYVKSLASIRILQDKALAALAIEDKRRQYAAAEKYLEDVLQSALATTE